MGAGSFVVRRRNEGEATLLSCSGEIDESFTLSLLLRDLQRVLIVDMDGVVRANSVGIMRWVLAMQELDVEYFGFINCQPAIVSQFNMVKGFGGAGDLISFYAPYSCVRCDHEDVDLIDLRKGVSVLDKEPPAKRCGSCNGTMHFDEFADTYFDYPRKARPPRVPIEADSFFSRKVDTPIPKEAPFQIVKELHKDITFLRINGDVEDPRALKRLTKNSSGPIAVFLEGVQEISDACIDALARSIAETPDLVYLARTPLWITEKLVSAWIDKTRPLHLASLLLQGDCETRCQLELELRGTALSSFDEVSAECPKCKKPWETHSEKLGERLSALSQCVKGHQNSQAMPSALAVHSSETTPDGHLPFSANSDKLVLGKYRVTGELARGGMGEVYLALRKGPAGFEKEVVLKRIRRDRKARSRNVERFLQEARLSARLSHPHIVQVLDLGLVGDEYVLAMEYVVGVDLESLLSAARQQERPWPIEICCRIAATLCSALGAAHAHTNKLGLPSPIIHRDVSPHNVLISFHGAIKLTDFGICVIRDQEDVNQESTNRQFNGKIAYAAPEQLRKENPAHASEHSDLYSCAVILYECLSHTRLVPRGTRRQMRELVARHRIPPIENTRPDLPQSLLECLTKALSLDPKNRFANASEFEQALEGVILELGVPTGTSQLARWAKKENNFLQDRSLNGSGTGPRSGEEHTSLMVTESNVDRKHATEDQEALTYTEGTKVV